MERSTSILRRRATCCDEHHTRQHGCLRPGFHFNFPLVQDQLNWQEWFDNNFATLLPMPSVDNGLKLITLTDLIKIPLFRMASNFMRDAVIAEIPAASADDQVATDWLIENMAMIDRALRRGTRYWSVLDHGVYTAEPGIIRAVDPGAYFRVESRTSGIPW